MKNSHSQAHSHTDNMHAYTHTLANTSRTYVEIQANEGTIEHDWVKATATVSTENKINIRHTQKVVHVYLALRFWFSWNQTVRDSCSEYARVTPCLYFEFSFYFEKPIIHFSSGENHFLFAKFRTDHIRLFIFKIFGPSFDIWCLFKFIVVIDFGNYRFFFVKKIKRNER